MQENINCDDLASRLKKSRKNKGFAQMQAAKHLGVTLDSLTGNTSSTITKTPIRRLSTRRYGRQCSWREGIT